VTPLVGVWLTTPAQLPIRFPDKHQGGVTTCWHLDAGNVATPLVGVRPCFAHFREEEKTPGLPFSPTYGTLLME